MMPLESSQNKDTGVPPIGSITEVHGPVVVIACNQIPSLRQALYSDIGNEICLGLPDVLFIAVEHDHVIHDAVQGVCNLYGKLFVTEDGNAVFFLRHLFSHDVLVNSPLSQRGVGGDLSIPLQPALSQFVLEVIQTKVISEQNQNIIAPEHEIARRMEVKMLLIEFEYAGVRITDTATGNHDPKQNQTIMGEIDSIDAFSVGK